MTAHRTITEATSTPNVVRRRIVAEAPPPAFEPEERDAPVLHPIENADGRPRWNFPLCLLETITPEKVARWDHLERGFDEETGVRRIVIQKWAKPPGGITEGWQSMIDTVDRAEIASMTIDVLRRRCGPANYRVWVYCGVQDDRGVAHWGQPTRCFNVGVGALLDMNAPPVAAAAPPTPVAPRAASPFALPGFENLPPPSSAAEAVAIMQARAALAREEREAEERADARRRALAREEEERADARARREREDEDRREERRRREAAWADEQEERERRRVEAREERREREDARERRAEQDRQDKIAALEGRAAQNASTDPIERLKAARSMLVELKEIAGDDATGTGGTVSRVVDMIMGGLEPHVPAIIQGVTTVMSERARIEAALAQVSALNARTAAAHAPGIAAAGRAAPPRANPAPAPPRPAQHVDPGIKVSQSAPASQPITEPAPPPSTPAEVAPVPVAAPADASELSDVAAPADLGEGDPCPDCGAPVPSCVHYPAAEEIVEHAPESGDDGEEGDDVCELCDECPAEHPDPPEGEECPLCPPCPHGDASAAPELAPTPEQVTALAALPASSLSGFTP